MTQVDDDLTSVAATGRPSAVRPDQIRVVNTAGVPGPDPRDQVPVLGFKEYWQPAIGVNKVPRRRPLMVKLLGQEVVLFRGKTGIAALTNHCTHRGAPLAQGKCMYEGTLSCPYHGWTYDEHGKVVAVLSEGPDSVVAGRASVRTYPVKVLKDIVFLWMGDGPPSDPEKDLPPELFDPASLVLWDTTDWHANWRPSLENFNDNHVSYVHRNSLALLMIPWIKISYKGARPLITNGGLRLTTYDDQTQSERPYREPFPALGGATWPKRDLRRRTAPLFRKKGLRWLKQLGTRNALFSTSEGRIAEDQEWATGPHMPGMMRLSRGDNTYTRWCVPVDENLTRQFYLDAFWPESKLQEWFLRAVRWPVTFRWINFRNFGMQDGKIFKELRYDIHERFSPFDVETIAWRRFCVLTRDTAGATTRSRRKSSPRSIASQRRHRWKPMLRSLRFRCRRPDTATVTPPTNASSASSHPNRPGDDGVRITSP